MTKRDTIRRVWGIYCFLNNIPHDQADVYSKGGRWFGQCRRVESNGYDTTLLSEWRLNINPPHFSATKIKDYT